jgi:LytR cell envelope-related transcriptional attenuator
LDPFSLTEWHTSPGCESRERAGSDKELPTLALSKICIVSPLHANEGTSWGRRIGIAIACLGALALAGFVGAVVGPHFKAASTSGTATTSSTATTFLHRLPTTTSTVAHSSVKVLVANGTQEPNAAGHFTQQLQQNGWNVSTPRNSTSAASTTTIYYAPSQQEAAALVASELGVPTTAVQPLTGALPVANATGLDIVVIIGPDLARNGFPATTVPAT